MLINNNELFNEILGYAETTENKFNVRMDDIGCKCQMIIGDSKFKTLRHIETVRNFLNLVINEIIKRQEQHDQTKLASPEVEIFDEYTPKLRECTYGSQEYNQNMAKMKVATDHHYTNNRHHPEHFTEGINGMNLIDLIEMVCDWKAASLRHNDGDIFKSIELNQKRFGYSDQIKDILTNTALLFSKDVFHKADES